jgi:hypothetical protein
VVIDVFDLEDRGSLPPKGKVNFAYVTSNSEVIPKWTTIRLAKHYDVILSHSTELLDKVWSAGVRKPMQVVPLPVVQQRQQLNTGIVDLATMNTGVDWQSASTVIDLNPNTDGLACAQAIANGCLVVMHENANTLIPDHLVTKIDPLDLDSALDWLKEDTKQSVELSQQGVRWAHQALGRSSVGVITNLAYQRISR